MNRLLILPPRFLLMFGNVLKTWRMSLLSGNIVGLEHYRLPGF